MVKRKITFKTASDRKVHGSDDARQRLDNDEHESESDEHALEDHRHGLGFKEYVTDPKNCTVIVRWLYDQDDHPGD